MLEKLKKHTRITTCNGTHLTPASLIIRGELLADLVDTLF